MTSSSRNSLDLILDASRQRKSHNPSSRLQSPGLFSRRLDIERDGIIYPIVGGIVMLLFWMMTPHDDLTASGNLNKIRTLRP